MKKLLLSLIMLLPMLSVSADECSITFSEKGYTNAQDIATVEVNDVITLTFNKGTNNNGPKYYNSGSAIRLYGGNTMTVTAAEGVTVTSVTMAYSSTNPVVESSTVTEGTLTIDAANLQAIWTGEANSFTFTEGGTSGHARISTIKVVYRAGEAPAVAAVQYSVLPGQVLPGTKVALTTATEGATIHFTVDGTEPTAESTVYDAPIAINDDVTIKAIAVKDGAASAVTEAAYKVIRSYETLAEILALEKGTKFICNIQNLVVFEVQGSNVFLYDPQYDQYGLIYKYNTGLEISNVIEAGWIGTVAEYGGLPQLVPDEDLTISEYPGSGPWILSVTAATIADEFNINNVRHPFILKDVVIPAPYDKKNCTGKIGETDVNLYNNFNIDVTDVVADGVYDIYGILNSYNGTLQFNPITFSVPTYALTALPDGIETVEEISTVMVFGLVDGEKTSVALNEDCEGSITISGRTGAEIEGITISTSIETVGSLEGLAIHVEPAITDYGFYVINIPEGYLNVAKGINENTYLSYGIVEPVEPVKLTLSPAPGIYEAFPEVTINADGIDEARANLDDVNITITNAEGEVVWQITAFDLNNSCMDWDTWQFAGFKLNPQITEAGVYTVNIPEGYFEFGNGAPSIAYTGKYTVSPFLYTTKGETGSDEEWGESTLPVIKDIIVDVYADRAIIHAFAGVEGYDLEVGFNNDDDDSVAYVYSIVNGKKSQKYTSGYAYAYTGLEDEAYYAMYLSNGYTYGATYEDKSGYFLSTCYLVSSEDYTYYFIAWPEEGFTGVTSITVNKGQTVYFDLKGNVIDKPAAGNIYIRVADGKATKVLMK